MRKEECERAHQEEGVIEVKDAKRGGTGMEREKCAGDTVSQEDGCKDFRRLLTGLVAVVSVALVIFIKGFQIFQVFLNTILTCAEY